MAVVVVVMVLVQGNRREIYGTFLLALIPRDFGVWVCECTCARVWGGVCGGVGVPVRACVGHAHVRLHRTSAHP